MTESRPDPQTAFALDTARALAAVAHPGRELESRSGFEPAPENLQARADEIADDLGIADLDLLVWEQPLADALVFGDRSQGILVLTTGLVDLLDDDALDAAMAHEMGHIRHGHVRRFGAAVLAVTGVLLVLARGAGPAQSKLGRGLVTTTATIFGTLLLLALVRRYERAADEAAVEHLDDPAELARALLAVRTGDPDADPRSYEPSETSAVERLLTPYPLSDERLPRLLDVSTNQPSDRNPGNN